MTRPLKGGAPRALGTHAGIEGRLYRRAYEALEAELGPFSAFGRLEAGRVAALYVQLQAATTALVQAQRARRMGKGRRPNVHQVERLARRQGLVNGDYNQALTRLQELVARSGQNGHHDLGAALRDTRQESRRAPNGRFERDAPAEPQNALDPEEHDALENALASSEQSAPASSENALAECSRNALGLEQPTALDGAEPQEPRA